MGHYARNSHSHLAKSVNRKSSNHSCHDCATKCCYRADGAESEPGVDLTSGEPLLELAGVAAGPAAVAFVRHEPRVPRLAARHAPLVGEHHSHRRRQLPGPAQ